MKTALLLFAIAASMCASAAEPNVLVLHQSAPPPVASMMVGTFRQNIMVIISGDTTADAYLVTIKLATDNGEQTIVESVPRRELGASVLVFYRDNVRVLKWTVQPLRSSGDLASGG
jgi:hypothetical protein